MHSNAIRSHRTALATLCCLGLAMAILGTAVPVTAGDEEECQISKRAKELANCGWCQTFKELVSGSEGAAIDLRVHEMNTGVILEVSGTTPAAVSVIHRVVDSLWSIGDAAEETAMCGGCAKRHAKLARAVRDRSITEAGAMVVLTSNEPEVIAWLQSDARETREWVSSLH